MNKQEEIQLAYARYLFESTEHDADYHAKSYDDLKDDNKDFWLWYAKEHLQFLHSKGVVIKVDRELPPNPYGRPLLYSGEHQPVYRMAQQDMINAGYVAVGELI